jgi:hypothetical protein
MLLALYLRLRILFLLHKTQTLGLIPSIYSRTTLLSFASAVTTFTFLFSTTLHNNLRKKKRPTEVGLQRSVGFTLLQKKNLRRKNPNTWIILNFKVKININNLILQQYFLTTFLFLQKNSHKEFLLRHKWHC